MKLLKKLLPIASVASVAAIVAPIATSCNTGDVIDGYTRLVPTVAQAVADEDHKTTGYKPEEAEAMYYDHISANPEVFYQDCKADFSNTIYQAIHTKTGTLNPEIKIKIDFSDLLVNKETKKLSYSIDGTVFAKNFGMGGMGETMDLDLSISLSASNIPYEFRYFGEGWGFQGNFWSASEDETTVQLTVNGIACSNSSGPTQWFVFDNETKQVKSTDTNIEMKWEAITELILSTADIWSSYHMANIKYNPEP